MVSAEDIQAQAVKTHETLIQMLEAQKMQQTLMQTQMEEQLKSMSRLVDNVTHKIGMDSKNGDNSKNIEKKLEQNI